jgi:predicted GNAT superfamily acetyltransferase
VPTHTNLTYDEDFLAVAIPFDWDGLLNNDCKTGYELAIKWRKSFREVCHLYIRHGYTFIDCVSDKYTKINYLILARDFNPNQHPSELFKDI